MHLVGALKLIFVTSLFIIFLFVFGKPSLEKYLRKDTIFVESKVKFNARNPPAITLMNSNPQLYLNLEKCVSLSNGSYDFAVDCYNNHFVRKSQLLKSLEPTLDNHNLSWSNTIALGEQQKASCTYLTHLSLQTGLTLSYHLVILCSHCR